MGFTTAWTLTSILVLILPLLIETDIKEWGGSWGKACYGKEGEILLEFEIEDF